MRAVYYPPANRTAQWYADTYPGTDMGGVEKFLIHSTEGNGWPGYDGGAKAPTLTYFPRLRAFRQHFPLNRSARALRDPDGTPVRENRDRVVQLEIVGTCDPMTHRNNPTWAYVPELADEHLDDIAALLAFLNVEWGVPLVAAPVWLPYPSSFGDSAARMSSSEYSAFRGVLAHMHASGNDHGDALIDHATLIAKAKAIVNPSAAPAVAPKHLEDEDMKVIRTDDGRIWITNGPLSAPLATPELAAAWCRITGQVDEDGKPKPAQVPYIVPASTTSTATLALIQTLAGQAAAKGPSVDVGSLAASLAPLLHVDVDPTAIAAQVAALIPDEVAQEVVDRLVARLAA